MPLSKQVQGDRQKGRCKKPSFFFAICLAVWYKSPYLCGMENYITIFNSITGNYHTMPFNNKEIEIVKSTPIIWELSSKELIAGIYECFKTNRTSIIFSMGLAYLLKSETYKLGKENNHNAFPIYLSRGNGDGFCRLCGSMFAEDVEDANNKSVPQIDYIMSIYGEKASVSKTKTGSNYTKPKKRKK